VGLRVAFLGNDAWSVPPLEALANEPAIELVAVITNAPKPAGRGSVLTSTPVADTARRLGASLVEADGVRTGPGWQALLSARPEALVVVAYGRLLSPEVLSSAPHGGVNLHLSLLPRWRGASPVQHAILAGDEMTGVTVMRMDAGLDTGPILGQLEEPVRPEDDAGSLGSRLAHIGAGLLIGVLRVLPTGRLPARAQDDGAATWAPRLGPRDRTIDWTEPADRVARRIRALAPEPGAGTTFRGGHLKILSAAADRAASSLEPGTIVTEGDRGVLIAAGDGSVWVREVAPAGRARMAAADWARGARFASGERLGSPEG